jgi:hypothetical protein
VEHLHAVIAIDFVEASSLPTSWSYFSGEQRIYDAFVSEVQGYPWLWCCHTQRLLSLSFRAS